MRIKRTLTAIVLSSVLAFGCSYERTTKNLETEEGRLTYTKEMEFFNLLLGNKRGKIQIEIEKHDGEVESYSGKSEYNTYILENLSITNPSGTNEYSPGKIPDEYYEKFQEYIEQVKQN